MRQTQTILFLIKFQTSEVTSRANFRTPQTKGCIDVNRPGLKNLCQPAVPQQRVLLKCCMQYISSELHAERIEVAEESL